MHDSAIAIALIGVLIFAAHLFEAVFRRTRIPDVLPLVIIGLILGYLFGIKTTTHFGDVGPIFTMITFILILFEAGTGLKISTIKSAYRETVILSSSTFFISVLAVGGLAIFFSGLGIIRSFILAAAVSGISFVVIAPMVNQLSMRLENKAVLLLESSITDVLSVVLTISLIDILRFSDVAKIDIGQIIGRILASFSLATAMGMLGAFIWSLFLQRVRNLQNSMFTTAAFVFLIFGLAEWLGYSGAVTALSFGITLGNIGGLRFIRLKENVKANISELSETEKAFFAELVFILKTLFFVYMGISLQIADWYLILLGLIMTVCIYI